MSSAFRIWSSLVSLAIIVQVGLAAYGAFHAVDESDDKGTIGKNAVSNGFDAHAALGYIILLAVIILVVLALVTRGDAEWRVRWSLVLLGLMIAQILFAWLGDAVSGLGVLHGMNALAVAGVAGSLAGREWAARRAAPAPA